MREREAKRREAERARQELETRHRIEARVRARQEAEAKKQAEEEGWQEGSNCSVCLHVHEKSYLEVSTMPMGPMDSY